MICRLWVSKGRRFEGQANSLFFFLIDFPFPYECFNSVLTWNHINMQTAVHQCICLTFRYFKVFLVDYEIFV